MNYLWIDPARPTDFKESTVKAALKKGSLVALSKHDGVRMHFVVNDQGQLFIRSRANLPFPAMANIEAAMNGPDTSALRAALAGFVIEGEAILVQPDGNLAPCEVTSGRLQALLQMERFAIKLVHFDTWSRFTCDIGKIDRLYVMRDEIRALLMAFFKYQQVESHIVKTMDQLDEVYDRARGQGLKGLVVVKQEEPYTGGKRVGAGWKMKPDITEEGIITGLIEAIDMLGSPCGRVGSFQVEFEDGSTGKAGDGKMTHGERELCWAHPEKAMGRIAEFTAMERFAKGGLRHPNWSRWRDTMDNKGVKI